MIQPYEYVTFWGVSYVYHKFYQMFKLNPDSHLPGLVNAVICSLGSIVVSRYTLKCIEPENKTPIPLEVVSTVFIGYLQWDILLNIWYYKKLQDWSCILHHLVYLVSNYIARHYVYFYNTAWWLLACEISTVFMQIRNMTKRGSMINNLSTALFIPTFLTTRVLIYGWGLKDLLIHSDEWKDYKGAIFIFGTLSIAYLLNLYWASLIIKKVARLVLKVRRS